MRSKPGSNTFGKHCIRAVSPLWICHRRGILQAPRNPVVKRAVSLSLAPGSPMLSSHSMPLASLEVRVPRSTFGKDGLHAILKLGEPSENSSFQYLPGLLFDCVLGSRVPFLNGCGRLGHRKFSEST